MNQRTSLAAALTILCASCYITLGVSAAPAFTGTGHLPGGTPIPRSYAFGVSNDGQTVIGSSFSSREGFIAAIPEPGTLLLLGAAAMLFCTQRRLGRVARSCTRGRPIWTFWIIGTTSLFSVNVLSAKAAVFTGLGDLQGGAFASSANGVSADGSVAVGTSDGNTGQAAFRWSASSGMVPLAARGFSQNRN